jgi:hypothetical protein
VSFTKQQEHRIRLRNVEVNQPASSQIAWIGKKELPDGGELLLPLLQVVIAGNHFLGISGAKLPFHLADNQRIRSVAAEEDVDIGELDAMKFRQVDTIPDHIFRASRRQIGDDCALSLCAVGRVSRLKAARCEDQKVSRRVRSQVTAGIRPNQSLAIGMIGVTEMSAERSDGFMVNAFITNSPLGIAENHRSHSLRSR